MVDRCDQIIDGKCYFNSWKTALDADRSGDLFVNGEHYHKSWESASSYAEQFNEEHLPKWASGTKAVGTALLYADPITLPFMLAACSGSMRSRQRDRFTGNVEPILPNVKHFSYQLVNIENERGLTALENTHYDLVVVPDLDTMNSTGAFTSAEMVQRLKASGSASFGSKLVFTYISIGEAEKYKNYWTEYGMEAPKRKDCTPGYPEFLVGEDPAKWGRSYSVLYWHDDWKAIVKGLFEHAAKAGFDGVVLDWVEMYKDECIKMWAAKKGLDPKKEMVKLIEEAKRAARRINSSFEVIGINGLDLGKDVPKYLKVIDGVLVEGTFFDGKPNASWNSSKCCDFKADESRASEILELSRDIYQRAKIPVFSIDYALKKASIAYRQAIEAGFIPLVTRISLSGITTTPSPAYKK